MAVSDQVFLRELRELEALTKGLSSSPDSYYEGQLVLLPAERDRLVVGQVVRCLDVLEPLALQRLAVRLPNQDCIDVWSDQIIRPLTWEEVSMFTKRGQLEESSRFDLMNEQQPVAVVRFPNAQLSEDYLSGAEELPVPAVPDTLSDVFEEIQTTFPVYYDESTQQYFAFHHDAEMFFESSSLAGLVGQLQEFLERDAAVMSPGQPVVDKL